MSRVYIIDKDGVIVETTIATESYVSEKGRTVKPKTRQEEKTLLLLSEINKQIRDARIALEKLEAEINSNLTVEYTSRVEQQFSEMMAPEYELVAPGMVVALMSKWRQATAVLDRDTAPEAYTAQAMVVLREGHALQRKVKQKQLDFLADQQTALQRIKTLQEKLSRLEDLAYEVEAFEGMESVEAQVDLYTGGKLTQAAARLNEIVDRMDSCSPETLRADMALLEELEQLIAKLPEEAKTVFNAQLWRQEHVQNVADRLATGGWSIHKYHEGEMIQEDITLLVTDARKDRAMITFAIDGEIRIDSFFEEDGRQSRSRLQQLVLGALREGGVKHPKGKCMDGEPGFRSHQANSVRAEDPEEPAAKVCRPVYEEKCASAEQERGRR